MTRHVFFACLAWRLNCWLGPPNVQARALLRACGLSNDMEIGFAVREYNAVSLSPNATVEGVETFLRDYSAARTMMLEHCLMDNTSALSRTREGEI